jgi:hypothetical protein
VDSIIANTPLGISTSLYNRNSTSLLVQNTGFLNVQTAISEDIEDRVLLPGGNEVRVDCWGFGFFVNSTAPGQFIDGQNIPVMNRSASLLGSSGYHQNNFFTRRRPQYLDTGHSQILDVKALGARGDGVTDDTPVLNSILSRAANMSSIVYFPFGVYVVKSTLHVLLGSRIIGQSWPQIMAVGSEFEDETRPKIMLQVGGLGMPVLLKFKT